MARLADFDLNDSSPATSPKAEADRAPVKRKPKRAPAATSWWVGTGLPDPKADPAEQLVVCERAIHDAKVRWRQAADDAMAAFIDEVAPYIAWVHEHKLYKQMKGNNGKLYRSFSRYLKERHGISASSGYRIARTVPLLRLLEGTEHPPTDLTVKQVQALHPVRVQHGDEAVERVWETAWAGHGAAPTPAELEHAKLLLDLKTKPEEDDEDERPAVAPVNVGAELTRARQVLVDDTLRRAVREQPEQVVQLARTVNAALREAGIEIE